MNENIIEFVRKRNYILVRELGQGGCGKTVLLRDDVIDEMFVCKKYSPYYDEHKQLLFESFLREIKLLHGVYHQNVVRVFNYHLYPEKLTGYILMEYVEGTDLETFLRSYPDKVNDVFVQAIEGFCHLESKGILHRDIRPLNLMVTSDGIVKIIDLGFGKRVEVEDDFDKSISLNWWCEIPNEFADQIYDFSTEVYFVGKLFEKVVQDLMLDFRFDSIMRDMCKKSPTDRFVTFEDVKRELFSNQFEEVTFWGNELTSYRSFANAITKHVLKVQNGARYIDDQEKVVGKLEVAYRNFMLEETTINCVTILRCFLDGGFKYRPQGFPVAAVKDFLGLMKASDEAKRKIIIANIQTRLDAIDRYDETRFQNLDNDIPF